MPVLKEVTSVSLAQLVKRMKRASTDATKTNLDYFLIAYSHVAE